MKGRVFPLLGLMVFGLVGCGDGSQFKEALNRREKKKEQDRAEIQIQKDIEMVEVKGGTFKMGSEEAAEEQPIHHQTQQWKYSSFHCYSVLAFLAAIKC